MMHDSDIRVRVRPDKKAAALYTAPWRYVDTDDVKGFPVRAAGIAPADLEAGAVPQSLNRHQVKQACAFHEAGHAITYLALGITLTHVSLTPGENSAHGFTGTGPGQTHPLPYWIAGHIAGQIAAQHYLELAGADSPGNLVVTYVQAADDYRNLIELTAEVPFALYYGSCDHLPMPKMMHVDIDPMRQAVRLLLCDAWPAVEALAEHLVCHGTAEPALLGSLPRGTLTREEIDAHFTGAVSFAPDTAAAGVE